jgi:8-oxo-dGTP pyrophosphatase MutT (NUDIX family)
MLAIVGGIVEKDEYHLDATKREVLEETNVTCYDGRSSGTMAVRRLGEEEGADIAPTSTGAIDRTIDVHVAPTFPSR